MSSLLLFVLMLFLMEPAAEVTVVNIETAVFDADLWEKSMVYSDEKINGYIKMATMKTRGWWVKNRM